MDVHGLTVLEVLEEEGELVGGLVAYVEGDSAEAEGGGEAVDALGVEGVDDARGARLVEQRDGALRRRGDARPDEHRGEQREKDRERHAHHRGAHPHPPAAPRRVPSIHLETFFHRECKNNNYYSSSYRVL